VSLRHINTTDGHISQCFSVETNWYLQLPLWCKGWRTSDSHFFWKNLCFCQFTMSMSVKIVCGLRVTSCIYMRDHMARILWRDGSQFTLQVNGAQDGRLRATLCLQFGKTTSETCRLDNNVMCVCNAHTFLYFMCFWCTVHVSRISRQKLRSVKCS